MPALRIVEAIGVVEHVSLCLLVRALRFARFALGFSEEKKLSIAALSHTLCKVPAGYSGRGGVVVQQGPPRTPSTAVLNAKPFGRFARCYC